MDTNDTRRFVPAVALPRTVEDFAAAYKLKRATTLLDAVEVVVRVLIEDPDFYSYIVEINDEDAREGSLHYDDVEAARMIREYAVKNGAPAAIANAKLKTLVNAMNAALRRFGASRNQRRMEA